MYHLTTLCQNKHLFTKVTELKQSFADFVHIWSICDTNLVPFGAFAILVGLSANSWSNIATFATHSCNSLGRFQSAPCFCHTFLQLARQVSVGIRVPIFSIHPLNHIGPSVWGFGDTKWSFGPFRAGTRCWIWPLYTHFCHTFLQLARQVSVGTHLATFRVTSY